MPEQLNEEAQLADAAQDIVKPVPPQTSDPRTELVDTTAVVPPAETTAEVNQEIKETAKKQTRKRVAREQKPKLEGEPVPIVEDQYLKHVEALRGYMENEMKDFRLMLTDLSKPRPVEVPTPSMVPPQNELQPEIEGEDEDYIAYLKLKEARRRKLAKPDPAAYSLPPVLESAPVRMKPAKYGSPYPEIPTKGRFVAWPDY